MTTDIIERLRGWAHAFDNDSCRARALREAADEIERLRKWKAEAIEVDDHWREVWDIVPHAPVLGTFLWDDVRNEIERLRAPHQTG